MLTLNSETKELIQVVLMVSLYRQIPESVLNYKFQVKTFDVLDFDLVKGTIKMKARELKNVAYVIDKYKTLESVDNFNTDIVEYKVEDIRRISILNTGSSDCDADNKDRLGSVVLEEEGNLHTDIIFGDIDKEHVLMDTLRDIHETYYGVLSKEK